MRNERKKSIHPIRRTKRWREVDELLRPLWPASNIVTLLEPYGVTLTPRAVYNWRSRGVSEEVAPALAALLRVPVEVVLRVSGKL